MINDMKINEVKQFFITAVKKMIDDGSQRQAVTIKGSLLKLYDVEKFKKESKKTYDYFFIVNLNNDVFSDIVSFLYQSFSLNEIRKFEAYRTTLMEKDDYVNYDLDYLVMKEIARQYANKYEEAKEFFAKKYFIIFSRTDEFQSIIRDENVETFENLLKCLPLPVIRNSFYGLANGKDIVDGMLYLARLYGLKITCKKVEE